MFAIRVVLVSGEFSDVYVIETFEEAHEAGIVCALAYTLRDQRAGVRECQAVDVIDQDTGEVRAHFEGMEAWGEVPDFLPRRSASVRRNH